MIVEWPGPLDFTSLLSVPHRVIVVNKNMIYVRRRFSVAHEFGHYALGQAGVRFFGERGAGERLANAFAAKLLMPEPVVASVWSDFCRGCEPFKWRVRLLAYRLGVSVEATRVRLSEIELVWDEERLWAAESSQTTAGALDGRNIAKPSQKIRMGPSGVHLFDRMTGLNLLLDEVRVPSVYWAKAPRQVSVALTNACDLACSWCYAPKKPAELDPDTVAGWLKELDENGCLGVGFGGGEPTLYRPFVDLCRYTARKTGLAVTLTTHAHAFEENLAADLAGSVHFVRVSMDGVGTTYESLRGKPFRFFLNRLGVVRGLAPFGLNYLVNARTVKDLDAATALAAEVGATEFLLLPEQAVGGHGGIDTDSFLELQCWVVRYRGPVPLTVSEAGAEGLPTCNPLGRETGLRAYAHVDASGFLKRTSFDAEGVRIAGDGVMGALSRLASNEEENLS